MAEWLDCQDGVGGYQGIDDVKSEEGEEWKTYIKLLILRI
jgi:hypothetical protein